MTDTANRYMQPSHDIAEIGGRPRPWLHFGEAWRYDIVASWASRTNLRYPEGDCSQIRQLFAVLLHEKMGTPISAEEQEFLALFKRTREIRHNERRRLEAEARILARQSFHAVAESMQTDVAVIEQYAYFFFDVANHLDARSRVTTWITGAPENSNDRVRREVLLAAYFGRVHVAEFLLSRLDKLGCEHDLMTVAGRATEWFELRLAANRVGEEIDKLSGQQIALLEEMGDEELRELPTLSGSIRGRLIASLEHVAEEPHAAQEEDQQSHASRQSRALANTA